MKKVIITFCFILSVSQLFPQTHNAEKIDQYVNEINKNISLDRDFHDAYMVHEIKFETNKRAIGKQFTSVKFYYPFPIDSVIEKDAGTDFLYIYKPPVCVSVQYNIAASQNNTFNYYFDEGSLVFYSYNSEGAYGNENEKYYFSKDELVSFETHTPENNIIKDKDFTRHDLFLAEGILKKASEYKKMFDQLVKLEDIDK
jgi:hypothetical protein